jgi:Fe-S-cluster containining protein
VANKELDILEQPVHVLLVKPTMLEQMAEEGRLPQALKEKVSLPVEKPVKHNLLGLKLEKSSFNLPSVRETQKQLLVRTKLKIIHENSKVPSGDQKPPCGECKTAACCVAFVVSITKMEYDSGLYGDAAIELTPEIFQQLRSRSTLLNTMNGPNPFNTTTQHVLEGMTGTACPFLTKDNRCGVYEHRPVVCRTYTCVGDTRVTPGMRAGTEPILSIKDKVFNK